MESSKEVNTNEKKNNSKVLLYTIIGILVALNAGLLYMWQKGKSEHEVVKTEMTKENQELKIHLEEAELLLEKYKADSIALAGKNIVLDQDLIDKKNEIAGLVARLRTTGNASASEIANLKKQIGDLNARILKLEEENVELKKLNDDLELQKSQLQTEKDKIESENRDLSTERTKYKSIAQRLQANNIKVEPLKKRWLSGKEVTTNKAKDVESLKISFGIAENYVAESGRRTIYVKITGPGGVTISSGSESGTFPYEENESKYTYKIETDFDKDGKQLPPSIWRPSADLKNGKYTVEMYTEGYKMGTTAFSLN